MVCGVGGVMNKGLVKHDRLPIAPTVALTVDIDVTSIVVGRHQTHVKTQGTCIRIAVRIELPTRWQFGKHGGFEPMVQPGGDVSGQFTQ